MDLRKLPYYYQRFFPRGPLAAFVKFFYYFHSSDGGQERILPQSLAEITLNIDGGTSFVIPPGQDPYFVVPRALDRIVGICFEPWGLYGTFGLRPGELSGGKALLQEAMNWVYPEMTSRVMEETTPAEMIARLEDYLTDMVLKSAGGDSKMKLIQDAVRFIDSQQGLVDLPAFYKRYSQSVRWVQTAFEASIGMSPKKYCRMKRFHYSVARLTVGTDGNWGGAVTGLTSVALDAGYYDQPHFIHEFRAFSGTHPKEFLKESNELNAINALSWF